MSATAASPDAEPMTTLQLGELELMQFASDGEPSSRGLFQLKENP